jgi:NAD(P)H-hydrate epimerase
MSTIRVTMKVAAGLIHRRARDANKGSNGRVLVVAGSRGMAGAAVLSSSAAVRSGAGLVRLAIVESQQRAAVIRAPLEITTQSLPEDKQGHIASTALGTVRRLIKDFKPTVLAVGPGLGVTAAVRKLIGFFLFDSSTPLVLDADGLNALSTLKTSRRFKAPVVLTPHVGELARLLNVSTAAVMRNRLSTVKQAAKKFGCVCLLKGPGTLITDGARVYENTTGNPAMASGGMGDVLTGLVASSWAQRERADSTGLSSAAFGVFLHGLCADIAVRSFPERTLLASDLIEALPEAYRKIWRFV